MKTAESIKVIISHMHCWNVSVS